MARSEILSPPYDGIPILDVSGITFHLPRLFQMCSQV